MLIEHEAMPHLADKLRGQVEDGFAARGNLKRAPARPAQLDAGGVGSIDYCLA
jgi:hypothetical protein